MGRTKTPTKILPADTSLVGKDLSEQLDKTGKARPKVIGVPGGMPMDLPIYLTVDRVMYDTENHNPARRSYSRGVLGHILTLDLFTKRSTVVLKMFNDPNAFTIEVDGEEIHRWVQNPDDLPTKLPELLAMMNAMDGRWAEMANLQPGDFVDEDEDGIPVVTRAEDIEDDDPILEDDDDPILEDEEDDVEWE